MARTELREDLADELPASRPRALTAPGDRPAPATRSSGWSSLQQADFAITTTCWDDTEPASLDPVMRPEPFREAMRGLEMREVREPEVFRLFFGGIARR